MRSPLETLKEFWGFGSFRDPQEAIIQSVMDGRDTLALMPTGGGKSLCYQVPAMAMDGICLVISPLIALMKDQVYHLEKRNIPAKAIYSGMRYREIDMVLDNCIYGNTKLLYLSPERLTTELARERIRKMKVNLIAVDEAHCISQWGYDFRPSYLKIADIRELHPEVPLIALTATATLPVVEDMQEKLLFRNQQVFKSSFARSNLAYVVRQEEDKLNKLLAILDKISGTAIVYAGSRKKTKDLAIFLNRNRISAHYYHAGLNNEIRDKKQQDWLNDQVRVMVCTNAFGMGIDKPDVRLVIHMDLPNSLEAYFQEAGRAGRDRKKAYAVLLYNEKNRSLLEKSHVNSFPSFDEIRRVYRSLGSYLQLATGAGIGKTYDFDLVEFARNFKLNIVIAFSAMKILENAGWFALSESIYVPSSVKITVGKEALYDFQLRNKKYDIIIKTILRMTQGAFGNYVNINERQIARFLKITEKELVDALLKIQQSNILRYRPKKDKPQITFLKERVSTDNLAIDQKLYHFRKERHKEKIAEAINYTQQDICRSRLLLHYFGEKHAEECGICDVCIKNKKTRPDDKKVEMLHNKIQLLLKKENLSIDEMVSSFAPRQEKDILKAVEYLLDEGVLAFESEKLKLVSR